LKPPGFKDQLLRLAQFNAETARRLVNGSCFDPLCRQLRSDLSKESFSRFRPRSAGALRKIKERRFGSLHCACQAERRRRDEPSAVHIETGHPTGLGRPRRSVREELLPRDEQSILHTRRADPANREPLGSLDFPMRPAAALFRFDRVGVGKRWPAARPRSGRRPLERHAEAIGTK
jgi:hypothetical protein